MTSPTTPLPALPGTSLDRLRWTIIDGLTLVGRQLRHLRNEPGQLIAALIFPAIMVVLFGYVFGSAISVPGGGNYREYLMPGLFAMTTFTGVMGNAMIVAGDAARGIMDRFRSMPMARSAVPFGQAGSDVLVGLLSTGIMVLCGLAVGWRAHHGLTDTLAAFGLIILLRYALSWVGIWIGLAVKNEETADNLIPLVFPVTMIANTFVPTEHMPVWLRTLSDWNPVSALVAALRHLFGNPGAPLHHAAWPLEHSVAAALLWSAFLLAVFIPLSVRKYRFKGR
ncbi:MAG: type transporter [Streptosporangiaceae bacterium]|jgi:ABC-2 type transport system permease protein|nr:type transporter [Streptosporangiaceae bacterium]